MFPGSVYAPGVSFPEQKSFPPSVRNAIPPRTSSRKSGSSGRSGSRPSRRNTASAPSAPTAGSKNRSVDPLSPQGRTQRPSGAALIGSTCSAPSCSAMFAPRARRHETVARMSAFSPSQRTVTASLPSAAQRSRRCACDLEAGIRTAPVRAPGEMTKFIARPPAGAIRRSRKRRSSARRSAPAPQR